MTQILTIFYDGQCPLCSLEMSKLIKNDKNNVIRLVDLHSPSFPKHYPNINFDKAMKILHGEFNGKILLGLDVTHRAWTLVGKGWWVAPLQFPLLKQFSHMCYRIVAKYRQPLSHFLYNTLGVGVKTPSTMTCSYDSETRQYKDEACRNEKSKSINNDKH